jgi:hypothetical protein
MLKFNFYPTISDLGHCIKVQYGIVNNQAETSKSYEKNEAFLNRCNPSQWQQEL